MLEELRLRDLGVIDDAVVELGPGLTVLTGETGAGKTMVLGALGLLLGGRADAALVRLGADRALVEGRLRVDPADPALAPALQAGAELDGTDLLVGRTVEAGGRSRAYCGGRSVPAAVLAELGEAFVAVHGQSEQTRLARPAAQRALLDRYAGAAVAPLLARYTADHAELRAVSAELAELTEQGRERAREADLLRFGVDEVAAVAPEPGEDEALAAEIARLDHAEALAGAAAAAAAALQAGDAETPDALTALAAARRALEAQRAHDEQLADLADRAAELGYLAADLAVDLAGYAAGVEADPARLAVAQERVAALHRLTRKYGDTVPAVLAWAEAAQQRLADLDGDDERIAQLRERRELLTASVSGMARELAAARRVAAGELAAAVTAELQALAMPRARLVVEVSDTGTLGPAGSDEVTMLLAAHPTARPVPVARSASGGERSRVMLALEVVLGAADPVPTYVFDEVDAGVGGRAAVEVGRRLARLATNRQVIVVTHLPQVAAFADRHLVVSKDNAGRVSRSGVRAVDGEDRLRELSRMLSGLESETGRGHAEELLAAAAAARSAP